MNKHHSGSEWELKWWFVDRRNGVVGQKWKKSGPEKWGWIGEKWADRSEKRKKKTHRERRLNWSLDRERRVRWCRSERRLDRSLDRSVRGVDRSLFVDQNLFRRPRYCGSERFSSSAWSGSELVSSTVWSGSELGSFEVRRCGVDRSLAASSLDRGASVWIVPFGSVCGSEQLSFERGNACLREECVWERGGKRLKWKYGLKLISVAFGLIYGQTENIFSLTEFTVPIKYVIFRKMISEFRFQPKQTDH